VPSSELMTHTMQSIGAKILVSVARIESTARNDFTALVLGYLGYRRIHAKDKLEGVTFSWKTKHWFSRE
jgi:hypothetical protein